MIVTGCCEKEGFCWNRLLLWNCGAHKWLVGLTVLRKSRLLIKLTACFILHGFGRFLGSFGWFATGISEHLKEGSFTLIKMHCFACFETWKWPGLCSCISSRVLNLIFLLHHCQAFLLRDRFVKVKIDWRWKYVVGKPAGTFYCSQVTL